MNRFVLFIIVIICFGIGSCGMQKKMQESRETSAHSSETSSEYSVLDQKVESMAREMLSEKIESLTLQDLTTIKEIYSEPDSSGRQYVVERTRTVINTSISEKQTGQRVAEQSDSMAMDIGKIVKKEMESDTAEFVAKKEKRKPPWWPVLILAVAVFAGFIILKLLLRWK